MGVEALVLCNCPSKIYKGRKKEKKEMILDETTVSFSSKLLIERKEWKKGVTLKNLKPISKEVK